MRDDDDATADRVDRTRCRGFFWEVWTTGAVAGEVEGVFFVENPLGLGLRSFYSSCLLVGSCIVPAIEPPLALTFSSPRNHAR